MRDKIRHITALTVNKPSPELDLIYYDDDHKDSWDLLPDWIKEKVRNRIEDNAVASFPEEPFKDDDRCPARRL